VGTPDTLLATSLGHHLCVGDGKAHRGEFVGQADVAVVPVDPQVGKFRRQGAIVVFHEVDQYVHPTFAHRPARDLAPRDQGHIELGGTFAGGNQADQ
jgi:hypothetical protein